MQQYRCRMLVAVARLCGAAAVWGAPSLGAPIYWVTDLGTFFN